jgi:cold shock protein
VQLTGVVKRRISDRGFGFIETVEGRSFFFHLTDLQEGLAFDEAQEGVQVDFEVKRLPSEDKAGAAQCIRRHVAPPSPTPAEPVQSQ